MEFLNEKWLNKEREVDCGNIINALIKSDKEFKHIFRQIRVQMV